MPTRDPTSKALLTPSHAEIDSSIREFVTAARDLASKGKALRRLLNRALHHAAVPGPGRPRCGAPTSLNRPCRGKCEPGKTRCAKHLSIDAFPPTTMEGLLSLAMPLLAATPRADSTPRSRTAPIACGVSTPQGPCDRAIEPAGFRCSYHAQELRNRRMNRLANGIADRRGARIAPAHAHEDGPKRIEPTLEDGGTDAHVSPATAGPACARMSLVGSDEAGE
jgi:hypothetical protein